MADKPDGVHKVNPQLWSLLVPISDLHEDPDNANQHDGSSYDAIAESYRKFGQQKPIVCDQNGRVIGGNGQLVAAGSLLGWTHIACVRFDSVEAAEQAAFALADNRSAELSSWNWGVLAETLFNLPENLRGATGFQPQEIEAIIANSPWEGMPDGAVPAASTYKGQRFVRMRIKEAADIDPFLHDLRQLLTKWGDKVEMLDGDKT